MCGIGGLMMFPKERTNEELAYLRLLTKFIANENELRGRDSTGFALFSSRGVNIFKHPIKATQMTSMDGYNNFMEKAINRGTKSILIHTRAGTKGSEKNNLNNHPIESARYVGIHNGMISNDDELFKKFNLHRAAEVDSEIIFRLLDTVGDTPDAEGLKYVAEKLQGMFTTAFVAKKDRSKLFLVRNDNPVEMIYIEKLNVIIFASQPYFLTSAIKDANEFTSITISLDDCVRKTPDRQTIFNFDMAQNNALEQLNQIPANFKENWGGYGNWGMDGYDEQSFFQEEVVRESTPQEAEATLDEILEEILAKLKADEIEAIDKHIDLLNTNAWHEGWTEGRKSLNEEMDQKVNFAYDEGYEKGFDDGYDDGVAYEKKKQVVPAFSTLDTRTGEVKPISV